MTQQHAHGHQAHAQQELAKHGHHAHLHRHMAFSDAEKAAVKFNSPERDAWQKPKEIVAAMNLRAGDTVADIGAGTGYMVAHLSKTIGERGTVIAIDAEDAMIEYLTKHIGTLGPATIQPQKASPDDPHLANESVNTILILDTWHHIDGRAEYAKKLFAALKPGGSLVIVDSPLEAEIGPPQEMRVSAEHVEKELAAAGFRTQVADESMPRHYLVVAKKG